MKRLGLFPALFLALVLTTSITACGGGGGGSAPAVNNSNSGSTSVAVAIAGGSGHTIALKSNGTVWAWGWNAHNQLGDGTTTDRSAPVQTSGFTASTLLAPAGITATGAGGQIGLSWTASTGAASYNLYWSTSPNVNPLNGTKVALGNVTGYTHTGLTSGTRYYYVVTAVNASGENAASSIVSATP